MSMDYVDGLKVLTTEEAEMLERLSYDKRFWESLFDFNIKNGGLTPRQYLKLVEEMNK